MSSEGKLGNLGEPALSLSPFPEDEGYRVTKSPGGRDELPRPHEPQGTQSKEADKVSGSERRAKRPEMGRMAVLAEHSTEEGGEPSPTGPTGGKAPPGITLVWRDLWERLWAHQPYPCNSRALHSRPGALRRWCSTMCFTC